ncbi:hypothetical protein QBC46DRAFT_441228 [Diplogelasinospora grovesii]|uniref:Aminoglycoside phosphotransferase domain-containing protein n=1 Tax=Diplogelasinospora grovesii TaxID=303347 RepID=A0AAN6N3P3_9PEZI|nr:hypothetical protein QBC46DRAFT_441228 [Diplogelasinospora grovesii]
MSEGLLTQEEAVSALLAYAFSGAIGPTKGKGVIYSLIDSTPSTFSWSAGLVDDDSDGPAAPVDRYLIKVDRRSKEVGPPEPIMLSEAELWPQNPDVASMDSFHALISQTTDPHILPVPPVYPIPGEMKRQETTGMGRQITRFIPGVMASSMALAFDACWRIQLPEKHLIGELIAAEIDGRVVLKIGPDRRHSLGGPFRSVRAYLHAYIKSSLVALEKQQGIDEYKERFLDRIRDFVGNRLHIHNIPAIVEDIPIVAMHADMGPHNVIVDSHIRTEIRAVIDWEFVASAPYASLDRIVEMVFRKPAPNGFGPGYDRADELREAFWSTIPDWKQWNQSEATQTFLEWFRFGRFMKPEWRPKDLPDDEAQDYWRENIRVVENLLNKYPPAQGCLLKSHEAAKLRRATGLRFQRTACGG